ncbi:MAG: TfoX/Sxy family protein [Gemmatimonadetes bacterium]|nr:TfoX/Sxy family protein [Gemmatimonadota bacterium]
MDLRQRLLALPGTSARRLSSREGFFTAGRMFALVSDRTVLLRLPTPAMSHADREPLIGSPVAAGFSWVPLSRSTDGPELDRLVAEAHDAVRRFSRRLPRSRNRRRARQGA